MQLIRDDDVSFDYTGSVLRAQRGDLAGVTDLVVRFQDLAVGTAFGWLGDLELARDAAQEAFVDVYLRIAQLREPAAFPAWLRTIVIKHCDRITRRAHPAPSSITVLQDPDVEVLVSTVEEAARLRAAVEALPPAERMVIALHYFAEITGPEIAAFLELPLPTVKKRLRNARARLREEGDRLVQTTIDGLRPSRTGEFADLVTFFLAIRAGDRARVRALLARIPELANAQQEWEPELVIEGVLPFASRATALITAIERDDLAMQTVLLDAGAAVDGVCGCVTGEPPLWTATVLNRLAHARDLLARGAKPDVMAGTGNTALHVAAMRGLTDAARLLVAHGAATDIRDRGGRTPLEWARLNGHAEVVSLLQATTRAAGVVERELPRWGEDLCKNERVWWTGIKALDLFAPIPRGGLVRVPFKAGVGMVVLLGELCRRITEGEKGRAIWSGFAQRPFDVADWAKEMAELGIAHRVLHCLAGFDLPADVRRDAFQHGLTLAESLAECGSEVLLILLADDGFEADIDASLYRLSAVPREGCITVVVVTPFPEKRETSLEPPSPFDAQIVLDRCRARKGLFPAIDPVRSTSRSATEACVGTRHLELAARARHVLERHAARDPELTLLESPGLDQDLELTHARALFRYLTQPFLVAEPFTGRAGEVVSRDALLEGVERVLSQEAP